MKRTSKTNLLFSMRSNLYDWKKELKGDNLICDLYMERMHEIVEEYYKQGYQIKGQFTELHTQYVNLLKGVVD